MVFPEMVSAQGRSDSRAGDSAPDTASFVGPSKSHEASSSQQNISMPRTTPNPTGAQTSQARDKDETQFEPMAHISWDGIITDEPTFPLSEIMALRRCTFSAEFYAYARSNGRTGVIASDLIMDILDNWSPMPDIQAEPKADQGKSKIEQSESKGKGKAKQGGARQTTPAPHSDAEVDAAANSDQAVEFKIPSQTFEQICKDLSKCIEGIDMSHCTQSERQQTRACLETIRAVSENARELARRSLAQLALSTSSSSMPSAIDHKTHCAVPRPSPWNGEPCGRRLPCEAHSNREEDSKGRLSAKPAVKGLKKAKTGDLGEVEDETKKLHQLRLEHKKDGSTQTDDNDKEIMSYSEAAKKAAQYYATTSAYARPS